MDKINKLIAEYNNRFLVTTKLKTKVDTVHAAIKYINSDTIITLDYIKINGTCAYNSGVWAIADVKELPNKFIIKLINGSDIFDEVSQVYKSFKVIDYNLVNILEPIYYFIDLEQETIKVSNNIIQYNNYQYLTYGQWQELRPHEEVFGVHFDSIESKYSLMTLKEYQYNKQEDGNFFIPLPNPYDTKSFTNFLERYGLIIKF